MASREDDATTPRSFDASDIDESFELDDFEIGALDGSLSRAEAGRMSLGSGSEGSSATTPTATATRLMEALEALSSETGEAMPPSLRSLLGQLQHDDQAMAGLFPFMRLLDPSHHGGGSGPRFHRMLQSLDVDAPPHVQLSALSDLCESLSLSSEEGLVVSGFSVDKFLPPLLRLIRTPPTMEVLLLAARALSSVFDMFATAAIPKAMGDEAFVPSICDKLLEIEYMDVAEMAFQILERVVTFAQNDQLSTRTEGRSSTTVDYGRTVIAANGFVALLQFIDFFPIEIQRTAARVVAGLCATIGVESTEELQVALPMIANLVRSADKEIVEAGCKSYRLLASSPAFAKDAAVATLVASEGTVDAMVDRLSAFASRNESSAKLSSGACTSVIEFLTSVLLSSHVEFEALIHDLRYTRLPPLVSRLLERDTITDDVTLLRDTLKLVMTILPTGVGTSLGDVLVLFSRRILPCIFHIYEVSLRTDVRLDCLRVIQRVSLMSSRSLDLEECAAELSKVSSFLARVLQPGGVITREQSKSMCVALQIVQIYLQSEYGDKTMVHTFFERYGVNASVRLHAESNEAEDVTALAKLVVAECMQGGDKSSSTEQLQNVVSKLEAVVNELSDGGLVEKDQLLTALKQLQEFSVQKTHLPSSGGAWITAHEIVSSEFASALARLLENDEGREIFAGFCFEQNVDSNFIDGLVACLQDAVSVEKNAFRVGVTLPQSQIPVSTGSVSGDVEQLTQHIKVRVKIDDELAADADKFKRNKRAVHDTVVLVEPLARVETIEEFISEKLFGTHSSSEFFDDEAMEELGTPRPHRRRRRSRPDGEEKHSEEDGDEEDDDGHDEEDHSDNEDEGDSEEESEDENDGLRSDRPRKQKRLQMVYRGVELKSDMSVLEALLQKHETASRQESSTSPVKDLSRIWTGSPHEFIFRVLSPAPKSHEKTPMPEVTPSTEGTEATEGTQVWEILVVLKHLHHILTNSTPLSVVSRASQSDRFINAFVSLQVNRALTQPIRVMTNSLPKWCYRIVEEFPFVLDYETRYDFKYATTSGAARAISYLCRTLWKKTASAEESSPAASRSISLSSRSSRRSRDRGSSTRSSTAALTNLSRMAKLPRLKVRVARARLLQSAMKLFTMYGGKKAIIEIEFLGEVGTGLGPTTEFYTLVCHELQGTQLKLWRNDKEVPADDRASEEPAVAKDEPREKKPGLPIRGYHRVAVYHCDSCKNLEIPRCAIHDQLLTHEKKLSKEGESESSLSIPQCTKCLDSRDWRSTYSTCRVCDNHGKGSEIDAEAPAAAAGEENMKSEVAETDSSTKTSCHLKWWIVSEEEITYLQRVYPRESESIKHPVLQCSHCDSVNFPGTDAGIVVLDHTGQKMISRTGRRMHERDYRAVTKHVSPLCEGTPLKQISVTLTRDAVETLVDCAKKSPELLDSDVESLSYLSEVAVQGEITVVDAPFGLYPVPYVSRADAQKTSDKNPAGKSILPDTITWFDFMGRFVAQAILDERLLNLPLSRTFLRALRGEKLVGEDVSMLQSEAYVREFDPAVAQSLQYLHELAVQAASEVDVAVLNAKKALVESMCLSFTLVGDASIELCENGTTRDVDLSNLDEYVRLNLQFLLHETIYRQVAAFHEGFEGIMGCTSAKSFLQSFTLQELEFFLADRCLTADSMWGRDGKELRDAMVCDHGYSSQSRAIHDLVAVLCEMTLDEQRLFVKFVTGANRLPLGGLAKLEPKLTVVRKLASDGDDTSVDSVLPSASTCTNYLKLPEYSTRDVMRDRLLYCIHEGQGSFHLS